MINGLGEKLRNLRIAQGFSQRKVAKRLDVSPSIISSYESGERTPSTENLLALAYLYRCSTDYLLGRDTTAIKDGISAEGLSSEQIQLLQQLIDTMRK